jgi:hypothetical protein
LDAGILCRFDVGGACDGVHRDALERLLVPHSRPPPLPEIRSCARHFLSVRITRTEGSVS